MTSPPLLLTRGWVVTAAGLSQVAAARAGMLPWWALPVSVILTIAVARQTGPVDEQRTKLSQRVAVAAVGVFAISIAMKAVAAGRDGADPLTTMRSLTEALIVLSLIMAPSWRSPRDYRVWLSVTTGVLVAATFGAHSPTTDILLVVAWILVLVAMASVQHAAMTAGVTVATLRRELPPSPTPLGVGMPVLASLLAGGVVFLALPAGLGGGGLATHLVHGNGDGQNGDRSGRSVVGVDTVGDGTLNLLVRGALPTAPLLVVPADSPPLWRGSIYSAYTGDSWQADPNQRLAFVRGTNPAVPESPTDLPPVGSTRTDHVQFVPGIHSSLVWAPGVPLTLRGEDGSIQGVARDPSNVRIIGAQHISGYTVTSAVATTSPARLDAAIGPDNVGAEWTALPTELPARVSQLAHQVTTGATTRLQAVDELETYLRDHETYSLNSPIPGPGEDAVADFLFRDHTGFCEQFASAEAVMLRTLDVPARVVSGLAYGTRQGNTRLLTDADAHAWVEVYYPGVGWSPTDPTAGVQLATTSSASHSVIAAWLARIARNLPGGRIGLTALLIALSLIALAVVRAIQLRANRSRHTPAARPLIGPVLAAFARFANARPQPAARAPSETAREYLARVRTTGQLETALATLEQECYGTSPPAGHEVIEAVSAFDGEREETGRRR
jgi:protein-glutamine gamma-glutamyltransferase